MPNKTKGAEHRDKLRQTLFPVAEPWIGGKETGWFRAPRTLPLILGLLDSKQLSGRARPSNVYLELWARDMGEGLIEMKPEAEHAYAAGYSGPRAVRTWQERMRILEKIGFIDIKQVGNQHYKYVLLVHPAAVVEKLIREGKVSANWLDTYKVRQIETKEMTLEDREKLRESASKVVPLKSARSAAKAVGAKTSS
jgi:hypothetical protein